MLFTLPESLKFLVAKNAGGEQVAKIAAALAPGRDFGSATFTVDEIDRRGSASPKELFSHGLALVTPLLWILFIINLMVFYFLNSWIPLIFSGAGLSPADAAYGVAFFQYGGTIGGLVLARPIDRWGFVPVAILFALACPVVAVLGYLTSNETLLMIATATSGFCLLGLQFGLNASAGLIYPTAFRANGVGWALGIGRFGSIAGPLVGGLLIGMRMPLPQLFLVAALPLVIGTVVAVVLIRVYARVEHTEGMEPGLVPA